MKKMPYEFLKGLWVVLPLLLVSFFISCGDDEEPEPMVQAPIASFQYSISTDDFLQVTFTNFSQNASTYSWDFGDGSSSTEKDPVYTYAQAGAYTVTLTATNSDGDSNMKSESFTITDPNAALKLLTGDVSKTWKLFREGTSMSLGPDAANPAQWWAGLTNDGSRPCLYEQEFTFHLDGTYEFDDKGMFWAEFGVFNNAGCDVNTTTEQCFEATAANMVNQCGDDVSAWLSGTHQFTYNPANGELTLTGEGAWIGIFKLGTTGESKVPATSVTTKITIEEFDGYDVMLVEYIYDGAYWPIRYASYSDASLEPELVTEAEEFGEDLSDFSPTEIFQSFGATGDATIDTIPSGSGIVYGVDDPADAAAAKVGQFIRTDAQYQELQFQTVPDKMDINFENITTVTVDVYLPSTNDYSGGLSKKVIVGLADRSQTEQWWTDQMEFINEGTDLALDTWITLTYNITEPHYVAQTDKATNPKERNDYDMIYVQIGGGDHTNTGTFYIRNLKFQ